MKTTQKKTSLFTAGKKALSLILSLIMVIGVMTFSSPISATGEPSEASTASTVSYRRNDDGQDQMTIDGTNWYNIYIFNGEQILLNVDSQANTITEFSTVDGEDGAKWFRAFKNAPAYNACFRVGVGAIPYANFEEFAVQFKSTCKVTKAVAYEKGVRLDFRKAGAWSNVEKFYSSTNKHLYTPDAQVHEGLSVVDVTTTEISNAFSTDNVPNLVLFPWRSDTNAALTGDCTFDIKWLGVFSQDGMADQFDYDDYAEAIAEKITVTFQDKDGVQIGEPTTLKVKAGMTFNDFVTANGQAGSYEWCKNNKDGTATVFAGWEDTAEGSTDVYTKTSEIANNVTVKATYISDAKIITAEDLNAAELIDVKKNLNFEYNSTSTPAVFSITPKSDGGSASFTYELPASTDLIGSNANLYIAIKGKAKVKRAEGNGSTDTNKMFVRFSSTAGQTSFTSGSQVAVVVDSSYEDDIAENFNKVWDMTGKANITAALGINIAPWHGRKVTSDTQTDIEYIALLHNENAAQYIDMNKYNSINVTYDGTPVSTTIATLLGLIENKEFPTQKKDGLDYKVLTQVKVNGELQPLSYGLNDGDVITTEGAQYENVYVYLPEQLNDASVYNQTQGAVESGYLRIKAENSLNKTTSSNWANIYAHFQITAGVVGESNSINSSLKNTVFPLRDFRINEVPYYSITYKTNISVEKMSNNMYIYGATDSDENGTIDDTEAETGKYQLRYPAGTRTANEKDQEFTFLINADKDTGSVMYNNNLIPDFTKDVAAIRIPIYHNGKGNDGYTDTTRKIDKGDYFDIKYLGFFPNEEAENIFDYDLYRQEYVIDVQAKLNGNTEATTILEGALIHTAVELPLGVQADGKTIIDAYLDSENKAVTKVLADGSVGEYTSITRNVVNGNYINDTDRGNLANLVQAMSENDGALTVAYIGGSVTFGQGSTSNKNGYAHQTTAWLESMGAKVTPVYAGIGSTGSHLGAFRIQEQVIEKDPDLVFVEFAVNDPYYAEGSTGTYDGLYYEYIFREIRSQLPDTEIVALFATNSDYATRGGMNGSFTKGVAQAQEDIAAHYGAASINMGDYLLESLYGADASGKINYPTKLLGDDLTDKTNRNALYPINEGADIWGQYFPESTYKEQPTYDIVHPNDRGAAIYAEVIGKYLAPIFAENASASGAGNYTLPEAEYKADWFDAKTVDLQSAALEGFTYYSQPDSANYTERLGYDAEGPYSITFDFGGDSTELSVAMLDRPKEGETEFSLTITEKDSDTPVHEIEPIDWPELAGTSRPHQIIIDVDDMKALNLDPNKTYTATMTFDAIKKSIYAIMVGGEKPTYTIELQPTTDGVVKLNEADEGTRYPETITAKVLQSNPTLTFYAIPDEGYNLRNIYDITTGMSSLVGKDNEDFANEIRNDQHIYTVEVARNTIADVNFAPDSIQYPVVLNAMTDGNGTINGDGYYSDYILPGDTTKLTAQANQGFTFAYWQRISRTNRMLVLLGLEEAIDASPLGSSTFYQPQFIAENTQTIIYIDDKTREILSVGAEPTTPPTRPGYTLDGTTPYVESTQFASNDVVTVMQTNYVAAQSEANLITVMDMNNEEVLLNENTINPAFTQSYNIKATDGNTAPVWTLKVGEGNGIPVYSGNKFTFSYSFKEQTKVTIAETQDDTNFGTAMVNTVASWKSESDNKAYFTGVYSLPVVEGATVTEVDHGILMSPTKTSIENDALIVTGGGTFNGNTLEGGNFDVKSGTVLGNIGKKENPTPVYIITKSLNGDDGNHEYWYGRAYMIYEVTENGVTTRYAVFAENIQEVLCNEPNA